MPATAPTVTASPDARDTLVRAEAEVAGLERRIRGEGERLWASAQQLGARLEQLRQEAAPPGAAMDAERARIARELGETKLPALELARAVRTLNVGDVVFLKATDPAAWDDVSAWCEATGHRLLRRSRDGSELRAWVQKSFAKP